MAFLFSSTTQQILPSPNFLPAGEDFYHPQQRSVILSTKAKAAKISLDKSTILNPFPISQLPYELREQIYIFYIASLPMQSITCSNARRPRHTLMPLYLASPLLLVDFSSTLFYQHATFSFSCPEALKTFAEALCSSSASKSESESEPKAGSEAEIREIGNERRRKDIRKVKIVYGRYGQPSRDWVHLLLENFPLVKEVTFGLEKRKGGCGVGYVCFENWWGCIVDAVREGLASAGRQRRVWLRIEDEQWGMEEVVRS